MERDRGIEKGQQRKEKMHRVYKTKVCGLTIRCDVIRMGRDYAVTLQDEAAGHIGCTTLSAARPSLTGRGTSATTSVLNCIGHKDDVIARRFSEAAAVKSGGTAVCTCGIHMDGITEEQIREILAACEALKEEVLEDIFE